MNRFQKILGAVPADATLLVELTIAATFIVATIEIFYYVGNADLRRCFTKCIQNFP